MVSTSIHPLPERGGYLRGLWSSISCPLLPRSFNLETAMECGEFPSIFFFFWLWRFEFPSLQLLPCGGMACVEGSLVPVKLFSFPRFLKRFLFKLLVFSFHSYFCEILAILCFSMPSFQLPLDFTAAISTLTSSPFQFRFLFQVPPFTFLAFFFSFLTSLFCALFPF